MRDCPAVGRRTARSVAILQDAQWIVPRRAGRRKRGKGRGRARVAGDATRRGDVVRARHGCRGCAADHFDDGAVRGPRERAHVVRAGGGRAEARHAARDGRLEQARSQEAKVDGVGGFIARLADQIVAG